MEISQYTPQELGQEFINRQASLQRVKDAQTPESLLDAVRVHAGTERRARVELAYMGDIYPEKAELATQALELM